MSGVLIIIAELICLVLMVVNAYLAFKAKQKDDLKEIDEYMKNHPNF